MAIDGLIILDNTGRPIIQSGFRSTSTSHALLHIDALNNALAKTPTSVDPVILIPSYSTTGPSACCHIQVADIRILCPISGDGDPLIAFSFMQTFVDILNEYFGNVSAATMKENFDVVYQLLEETLDSGGHPLTTSSNALRDIVLPPSLLTKLLSVAGANINSTINSGSGLGGGPFSSPIPWRKAGLRYASNEIYFDMVEDLQAIVNKSGATLSTMVWGKIEANCRLSGNPDCLLKFTNPEVLADCSFHPCVRLKRWGQDKSFSFVPPDGRFILAEYRYTSNPSPASSATTSAAPSLAILKDNVAIPFALKPVIELEDHGGSFDITLTSRMTARPIERLVAEIHLGEGTGGIKCVATRGGTSDRYGRTVDKDVVGSSWAFDSNKKVLRWEIPSVPGSSIWYLRGSFTTPTSIKPRPTHAIKLRYEIPSHTYSSLKVDQLKVTGETYKLYKGVRGRTTGNIEWRW